MKRYLAAILILASVTLGGCSAPVAHSPVSGEITYVSPDFWPENTFVSDLPRPEGEAYWVIDESPIGRYSMSFLGMTEEESEEYIEILKDEGFREYRRRGNDVSVGLILYRGELYLSVAYSEGSLGFTAVTEK